MDKLILAFAPCFAAGLAVQQFIEIIKPLFKNMKEKRTYILKPLSLFIGLLLSFGAGLRVLSHLGYSGIDFWDAVITGFIISGGTEGFNSILKFLGYSKQKKKGDLGVS